MAGLLSGAMHILRVTLVLLSLLMYPSSEAIAQTREDRGYVTRLLEDLLSVEGSEVLIEGMSGVTRGPVKVDRVSASDHLGEWLVIRNLVIDWNRTALVSRNVNFREVSAEEVTLRRWASADEDSGISPEAGGFSFPQLPVSFRIGDLNLPAVTVSGPAFETPAQFEIGGNLNLARSRGEGQLEVARIDGRSDFLELELGYDSGAENIDFKTRIREAPGGAASRILGLPGLPSIDLQISGLGTFDDFAADLNLETNGIERIDGSFTSRGDEDGAQRLALEVGGDVRPLFEPDFRDFFGPDGEISVDALRRADSSFQISEFRLSTAEMTITGSADVGSDNIPNAFSLRGKIQSEDGESVLLPAPEHPLSVQSVFITADFDADVSERWFVRGRVNSFERNESALESLVLEGNGLISDEPGARSVSIDGFAEFLGLELPDSALARILGANLRADSAVRWEEGSPIRVDRVELDAANADIAFEGEIRAEDRSLILSGETSGSLTDLTVFEWPAPLDINGWADLTVAGDFDLLGGDIDARMEVALGDLHTGIPDVDTLLGTDLVFTADLLRDIEGTEIRGAVIKAEALQVSADGRIGDARGALALDATLRDLAFFAPPFPGEASVVARLRETDSGVWHTSLVMNGPDDLSAALLGVLQAQASSLGVTGRIPGLPSLPAPFDTGISVEGRAEQDLTGWMIDLQSNGPGAIRSRLNAQFPTSDDPPSYSLRGDMPLRMINAVIAPNAIEGNASFEVQTSAPLSVEELSGGVAIKGARLSVAGITEQLEGIDLAARLTDGQVRIDGNAAGSSGGGVLLSGTTELEPPFRTRLSSDLQSFRLERAGIFSSAVDGRIVLSGDTTIGFGIGGGLNIGDTVVHLTSKLFPTAAPIPTIRHVNEPANVRQTRARAGVKAADEIAIAGPAIDLNVAVSVPGTIRVEGASLSANLGGELHVGGNSSDIRPTGKIGILDGKMSLLGRRLDLTAGNLWLRNGLVPWVEFVARGERRDIVLDTVLSGPVNDLNVEFIGSSPFPSETEPGRFNRYPPDEAVSRFFLGNPINGVSALQAAQFLFGVASAASGSLDDPFAIQVGRRSHSTAPLGDAPLESPRPARRDVLLRVDSDRAGDSEVVIELELNNNLSVVGRSRSGGNGSIGLFFTRDY
ncbi:translocation/assembly module TamB domain-containing protein [Aliiruegeria sabulilitoris]|uniref:translocation/assembly module TamB domain-containing protein n=1 Tax=Aliiruegeria sabulilitoris TaxID=1510458 RepID=UPI0008345204|nr:translocation/assembly module TamB domain-containing protein [Aliiruegeria sabulilitoris]NDR55826.1 hypothetical protein [Pseudoruegeria sp. M32A2M]